MRQRNGFTLVELLVVIGIIALLISVLLPALSAARRSAAQVKCAAALREIGNAHSMYVSENQGWSIPTKMYVGSGLTSYSFANGWSANSSTPAYWMNFLSKYVTKSKVGYEANQSTGTKAAQDAVNARSSIFWGCPAWSGYAYTSSINPGDLAVVQTGYGWNAFPEYTASFPKFNINLNDNPSYVNNMSVVTLTSSGVSGGTWYRFTKFTRPAERALCGDALFWLMQTEYPKDSKGTLYGCRVLSNSGAVTQPGATTADWYRHGKYASLTSDKLYFNAVSGKVAYNILYADGHVGETSDRADINRAQRMRYPG